MKSFMAQLVAIGATLTLAVQPTRDVPWDPYGPNDTFLNPIIHADYSDPDVVRVGGDFYMVASSFTAVPGLPILHSTDLVNWSLVNHALPRLVPEEAFKVPRHGAGVWAPAIRYRDGKYWIYYPDPDFGIYVTTATNPRGTWSEPVLVKGGKGLIDPCPLWDDDGSVYLVHAFARSRAGFANVLHLNRLSADGTRVVGDEVRIIDGDRIPGYTTLEGPKFYKREGWYYLFAPAGGVKQGWQAVFRARRIEGPYEHRRVLAQGRSDVNGPHQGALVDTPSGAWWFIHFQDADAYGRVVHMQPVHWRDGWPIIGSDEDGDGTGEPRRSWPRPLPASGRAVPATTDTFDGRLGLQWQWQANPDPGWATVSPNELRLRAVAETSANRWSAPNLLLQKFPAPEFVVDAHLDAAALRAGGRGGLIVFGADYAWAGVERSSAGLSLVMKQVTNAADATGETEVWREAWPRDEVDVRLTVRSGAVVRFAVLNGTAAREIGPAVQARAGRWVGAKFGVFAASDLASATPGTLVVRRVTVSPR